MQDFQVQDARSTDHPRVCGENLAFSLASVLALGSPPRVRGARNFAEERDFSGRIPPACAGKTLSYIALEGNRFAQNVNMVEGFARVDERSVF